jgi:AcrR family transcriptional regulator
VRRPSIIARHGDADAAAPLPGRRERAKLEKRRRLVAAARALFSRKGFAATTTSEIAERADIGAGTLFLYVQSKEELLVLIFQEDMSRVRDDAFATLPARASLLDEVLHVYAAMSAFHDRDRMLARVFVKEMAFVGGRNRARVLDFMETLFGLSDARIDAAKTRGELAPDVPARTLSQNLFAAFFLGLQQTLGTDVPVASPEQLAELRARLALQLRGLGPSPANPSSSSRRRTAGRTGKGAR